MDLQEFKSEVLPSKQKLFRLAVFMLQDKEDAEDILQDVFLKLWTNKHRLNACNNMEAFAMTVTKNLCLDKLRTAKLRRQVDITGMELDSGDADPFRRSELADSMDKIQGVIDNLPEQQKLILHLRDVEGYSYEEIAQITSLTINNIRVNLSRARRNVRDGFIKIENYEK